MMRAIPTETYLYIGSYTPPEPLPSPPSIHLQQLLHLLYPFPLPLGYTVGLADTLSIGTDPKSSLDHGLDIDDAFLDSLLGGNQGIICLAQGRWRDEVVVDRDTLIV